MRKSSICCIVLAAVMAFNTISFCSVADQASGTQGEIDQAKQQISDYKNALGEVQDLLSELDGKQSDAQAKIAKMDLLSKELNEHLFELQGKLETKRSEIQAVKTELEIARSLGEKQYDSMRERIQYMYEFGNVSYVDIILGSGSLSDLYNELVYIQEVSSYDRKKLNEYKDNLTHIEESEQKLTKEKAELEDQLEEQQAAIDAVDEIIAAKRKELVLIASSIENARTQEKEIEADINEGNAYVAELEIKLEQEAEAMRIAAAEAAAKAAEEARRAREEYESSVAESISIAQSEAESASIEQSIAASVEASIQQSIEASIEASIAENATTVLTPSEEVNTPGDEESSGDIQEETLPSVDEEAEAGEQDATRESTTVTVESTEALPEETMPTASENPAQKPTGPSYAESGMFYLYWPVPKTKIVTSTYGPRPEQPVAGVALFHSAIDIAPPYATAGDVYEIVAAADGYVYYVGDGTELGTSSGGNQVWIYHEDGAYITIYMHCASLLAAKGTLVSAGDTIAIMGASGLAAGKHLDFRIMEWEAATSSYQYRDPLGDRVVYLN